MTCHLLFLFKKRPKKKEPGTETGGVSTFLFRIYVGVLLIKFCMQCPYSRFKSGTDFVKKMVHGEVCITVKGSATMGTFPACFLQKPLFYFPRKECPFFHPGPHCFSSFPYHLHFYRFSMLPSYRPSLREISLARSFTCLGSIFSSSGVNIWHTGHMIP